MLQSLQVGACIVNPQNKIVGIGYNKLPVGCDEDTFKYWKRREVAKHGFEETKYAYGETNVLFSIFEGTCEKLMCSYYMYNGEIR